jgi:hypothetical protein
MLDGACFEVKAAIVPCLAEVFVCEARAGVAAAAVIPPFLEPIEEGVDLAIVKTVFVFFIELFRAVEGSGEGGRVRMQFLEHRGKEIASGWSFDDDEEIAQIATELLIEGVDPFAPKESGEDGQ